jgi:hypothetical protein
MADKTIATLDTEITSPGANDLIGVWDIAAGQYKKCKRSNLVGAAVTGGGTIALGGFTLSVPATMVAAGRNVANTFNIVQTFSAGLNVGTVGSTLSEPSAGVVRQQVAATILANNGEISIPTTNGLIVVQNITANKLALVAVEGGNGVLIYGNTANFSGVFGTAGRVNIYTYVAGGVIVVQNSTGAAATLRIIALM